MLGFGRLKTFLKRFIRGKIVPMPIPVLTGNLLSGRNAVITGGGSGIGLAIAKAFAQNGANVVIMGRDKCKLEQAVVEIRSNVKVPSTTRVNMLSMDITNISQIPDSIARVSEMLEGEVDILVNNAGIARGWRYSETSEEDFDMTLNTNLKGAYFLSKAVAERMITAKVKGNILNVTSSSSLRPGNTPYILSKWGLRSFTLGLAKMLVRYGIVVNGLAPGPTNTKMILKNGYDGIESSVVPAGRLVSTEEVGNMAVVLVSSLGRMVVGDTLFLTGGSGVITVDDCDYAY